MFGSFERRRRRRRQRKLDEEILSLVQRMVEANDCLLSLGYLKNYPPARRRIAESRAFLSGAVDLLRRHGHQASPEVQEMVSTLLEDMALQLQQP